MSSSASETTTTPVAEDHLDVDVPIPGQSFACLSFVSPEKILAQKNDFFLQEFWKYFKAGADNGQFDLAVMDKISDAYDTFMHECGKQLEEAFHQKHKFQTTIRGLKVRGVYSTQDEARVRSKVLQRMDKHHHVFIAPVGYWVPWDPNADQIEDQVYQEEQLNELMKNYKENEVKRDIYYEEEKSKMKKEAMEENLARKKQQSVLDESTVEEVVEDDGGGAGGDVGKLLQDAKSHEDLAAEYKDFKSKK